MRILLPQSAEDAAVSSAALAARGHTVLAVPLVVAERVASPKINLASAQGFLVTASEGARALADNVGVRTFPVFCESEQTAAELRRLGFKQVAAAKDDAADLARLIERSAKPADGALVYACSTAAPINLTAMLSNMGFAIRALPLYTLKRVDELPAQMRAALADRSVDSALFTTPDEARAFVQVIQRAQLEATVGALPVVAASPVVAAPLRALKLGGVTVPATADPETVLAAFDVKLVDKVEEEQRAREDKLKAEEAARRGEEERRAAETAAREYRERDEKEQRERQKHEQREREEKGRREQREREENAQREQRERAEEEALQAQEDATRAREAAEKAAAEKAAQDKAAREERDAREAQSRAAREAQAAEERAARAQREQEEKEQREARERADKIEREKHERAEAEARAERERHDAAARKTKRLQDEAARVARKIQGEEAREARRVADLKRAEDLRTQQAEREKEAAAEQAEGDRLAAERVAAEQAELARQAALRVERERTAAAQLAQAEAERIAAQTAARLEREHRDAASLAVERQAREQREREQKEAREKAAAEKAERERLAREQREREEKEEREREAAARAERARLEEIRIAPAKSEAERRAVERAEAERLKAEHAEAERLAREHLDRAEKEVREQREHEENARREQAAAVRAALEVREREARAEEERLARERLAAERAEAERLAAERAAHKAEEERLKREQRERVENELREQREREDKESRERLAVERAEAERLAAERAAHKAEEERLKREQREREDKESAERLEREHRAITEKEARERAERAARTAEVRAREQAEAARVQAELEAQEKIEAEARAAALLEREQLEEMRIAAVRAESDRQAALRAAQKSEQKRLAQEQKEARAAAERTAKDEARRQAAKNKARLQAERKATAAAQPPQPGLGARLMGLWRRPARITDEEGTPGPAAWNMMAGHPVESPPREVLEPKSTEVPEAPPSATLPVAADIVIPTPKEDPVPEVVRDDAKDEPPAEHDAPAALPTEEAKTSTRSGGRAARLLAEDAADQKAKDQRFKYLGFSETPEPEPERAPERPAASTMPPPQPRRRGGSAVVRFVLFAVIAAGLVAAASALLPSLTRNTAPPASTAGVPPAAKPSPYAVDDPAVSGRIAALEQKGTVSADDLAAARREINERLAALEGRAPSEASEGSVTSLGDSVSNQAKQLAAVTARIATLEAAIGNTARLEDLAKRLNMLEGRSAEANSVLALADRVTALESSARRTMVEQSTNIALLMAVAQWREAVIAGHGFALELQTVKALAARANGLAVDDSGFAAKAARGIATRAELQRRFTPAAAEATRASAIPEGTGAWYRRILGRMMAIVTVRRLDGDAAGMSTSAVLARAERRLAEGDLAAAVNELGGLDATAAQAMAPWLEEAGARVAAERAIAEATTKAVAAVAATGNTLDEATASPTPARRP